MTNKQIEKGLLQLGFTSGWAISGEEIVLWENETPAPSIEEIRAAAEIYKEPEMTIEQKLQNVGLNVDDLKVALGIG